MKNHLTALLAAVCLSACGAAAVSEPPAAAAQAEPSAQWQASTLSPQTIAKADATVKAYQGCLNSETLARINARLDSRLIADGILKACEPKLTGIKDAFDAEGVPAVISERYMRKQRSQGAQAVLRYVMSVQAMRAGAAEEQASVKIQRQQSH